MGQGSGYLQSEYCEYSATVCRVPKIDNCFSSKIDTLPLSWATHRLGGVTSPANAAYSAAELTHQLLDSKAQALFTCVPLLPTALEAASRAGLPKNRIYLIDLPAQVLGGAKSPAEYKTLEQFVKAGKSLPELVQLKWGPGDGARRTAFLCYSSGTSGLPVSAEAGNYDM